jgi:hypothetical protein
MVRNGTGIALKTKDFCLFGPGGAERCQGRCRGFGTGAGTAFGNAGNASFRQRQCS